MVPSPQSILHRWAKTIQLDQAMIRDRAERFYKNIMDILERFPRNRHDDDSDPISYQSFWPKLGNPTTQAVVSITPFKETRPVTIPIKGVFEAKEITPDFVVRGNYSKRGDGYREINLFLNGLKSVEAFRKQKPRVIKDIFSAMLHELTHAKDISSPKMYKTDERGDLDSKENYHNDPREIRAFMQQVVHEVSEYIDDTWNLLGTDIDVNSSLIEKGLAESETWQFIKKHLTPQTKRLILRTVGQSVISQVEKLSAA